MYRYGYNIMFVRCMFNIIYYRETYFIFDLSLNVFLEKNNHNNLFKKYRFYLCHIFNFLIKKILSVILEKYFG